MDSRIPILSLLCCLLISSPVISEETNPFAERSLRIGFDADFMQDINRTDAEVSMKFWTEEISEQTDIPITVTFYHEQMKQMVSDFENGTINYVFTAPMEFVKHFNSDHLADGFTTLQTTNGFHTLVLLTRQHENTDTIRQLQHHSITLLANNELQEVYLDLLSMQTFKQNFRTSFHLNKPENNSQRLILQLFFKKTDAVMVSEASFDLAVELNPQLAKSLQVVKKLNDVPQIVGFFHKAVAEDFREEVIHKSEKFHEYRRGQQVLEIFKSIRMQRSATGDLDNIIKLYQEYQAIKGQASNP